MEIGSLTERCNNRFDDMHTRLVRPSLPSFSLLGMIVILLLSFLIFSPLLAVNLVSKAFASEQTVTSSGQYVSLVFDSYPRISPIVIDGIIFLPTQQPVSVSWAINSTHKYGLLSEDPIQEGYGTRYIFKSWNDFDTNYERTIKISKETTNNKRVIALFIKQNLVTVSSDYGNFYGAGWYDHGAMANIRIEHDIITIVPEETRAVFTGWNMGFTPYSATNFVEVTQPLMIIANWKVQHKIDVLSATGGHVRGSGWYDEGNNARISADESVELKNQEHKVAFNHWRSIDDTAPYFENRISPTTSIFVDKPYNIEAVWDDLYYVKIDSEFGNPIGEDYYRENDMARISVESIFETEPSRERLILKGWQFAETNNSIRMLEDYVSSNSFSFKVAEPITLVPSWTRQYFVDVDSQFGEVHGRGWYDEGSKAIVKVNQPEINLSFGRSAAFSGWLVNEGDMISTMNENKGQTTFVIDSINQPYKIEAIWKLDELVKYAIIGILATSLAVYAGYFVMEKAKRRRAIPEYK